MTESARAEGISSGLSHVITCRCGTLVNGSGVGLAGVGLQLGANDLRGSRKIFHH